MPDVFVCKISAEGETILPRHHQVEHDQVDGGIHQYPFHHDAVRRSRDAIAVIAEKALNKLTDLRVIINDKNVGLCLHVRESTPSPLGAA